MCGLGPSTDSVWPGAIKVKSVARGHKDIFEVCEVCGLTASTDNVLAGAINLKCVAWGHLFEVCGLGPST